jgi:ankyrin repeat protein
MLIALGRCCSGLAIGSAPAEQDPDGRTPLHVAASRGSIDAAAAICRACKPFVSPVDVYGATPLDNARQRGNDTIVALLLAERAKSGSDPRLRSEHEAIQEWVAKNKAEKLERRKLAILKTLPEHKMAQDANAVNSALQDFAKVCDMPCICRCRYSIHRHVRSTNSNDA